MSPADYAARLQVLVATFEHFRPKWELLIPRKSYIRVMVGRLAVAQLELAQSIATAIHEGRPRTAFALSRVVHENLITMLAFAYPLPPNKSGRALSRSQLARRFYYASALERHDQYKKLKTVYGASTDPETTRILTAEARAGRRVLPNWKPKSVWHHYNTFAGLEEAVTQAAVAGTIPKMGRGSVLRALKDLGWDYASKFIHASWIGVEPRTDQEKAGVLNSAERTNPYSYATALMTVVISVEVLATVLGQQRAFQSHVKKTSPFQG